MSADPGPEVSRTAQALPAHELRRVAYHEAGHVVVACLAGFTPRRANVGEENGSGGFGATDIDWTPRNLPLRPIDQRAFAIQGLSLDQRKALVYLAGSVAEELGVFSQPAADDNDSALAFAEVRREVSGDREARELLGRLRGFCRELLTWSVGALLVRSVAGQLEAHRTLGREDLKNALMPLVYAA